MKATVALGITFTFLAFATAELSHAQSVEQLVQAAINSEGKDCPKVTAVKALGTTTSGTPIIAAACSNGTRHVLKILPGNALDYVSTCGVFEATAGVKCF